MKPTARSLAAGLVGTALFAIAPCEAAAAPNSPHASPASAQPKQAPEFRARTAGELLAQRRRVARASVIVNVEDKTCAGSVVGTPTQVLTAAHCVPDETATLEVVVARRRIAAVVALIDRTRDTALLALEEAVEVEPLELDPELPAAGDRILFVGRPDSQKKAQVARIVRLGSCPSLPGVPDALFTSVQARPGDSGAPLVNDALRVVAVIHGGAACHIAAPTSALAKSLAAPDEGSQPDEDRADALSPPTPSARYQLGPFTLERSRGSDGFSVRFRFELGNTE